MAGWLRGLGAYFASASQQFRHPEILQRRTEEHRRLMAFAIGRQIEEGQTLAHQFDILVQPGFEIFGQYFGQAGVIDPSLLLKERSRWRRES